MKFIKLVKANKDSEIKSQLEEILKSLEEENISYDELAYLDAHKEDIKRLFPNDPRLWEAAGIPEEEWRGCKSSKKLVKSSDIPANSSWKWTDYASGNNGGFFMHLCKAIEVADDSNLALLKKAYPNLINLFEHRFDGTDGVI